MAIVLTYRRTSRLSMRIVKNGDVHVSAPLGMSKKEVEAFICQHQEWIVETRKRVAERQEQQTAFYHQLPLTTKAQKTEAAEKVRALVEPMIERYSVVMGVRPSALSFKPMKSRWGGVQCEESQHLLFHLPVAAARLVCGTCGGS